ncbi:MAG TPA: transcription-repair coupling factor, partial [candidate division Zixibacteria bacterium]|nr:transcription-repair coupling factor [candidate division Zixibacteria bacterium]
MAEECGRPLLYLCANPEDAYALAQDMEHLPCASLTERYPALGKRPYEFAVPSGETRGQRISALAALDSGRARILIAPLVAALEPTLSRARLASESATLTVGAEFDFETLVATLIRLGFRRVPNVEEIGDFSQRGGLLDFFSPGATSPVRVEFFGD